MHIVMSFMVYIIGHKPMIVMGSIDIDPVFWFNLNSERKFAATFSALIIVFAATCAVWSGLRTEKRRLMLLGWFMLGGIVFFMACDEFFEIHEQAGRYFEMNAHFGEATVPGWVRVMSIVVLIVMIPLGLFWWNLPKKLRVHTAIAGFVFLTGAMGIEIISSKFVSINGAENFAYMLIIAAEESMEMLGILILIDAFMLHLSLESTDQYQSEHSTLVLPTA
ncbi:MAG: hypothetical protein AAF085_06220 [Planctomycetota bacterium]